MIFANPNEKGLKQFRERKESLLKLKEHKGKCKEIYKKTHDNCSECALQGFCSSARQTEYLNNWRLENVNYFLSLIESE